MTLQTDDGTHRKKVYICHMTKKEAANAYNVVISHILSEQNIFSVKQICVMQPRCGGSFSVVLGVPAMNM